MKSSLWENIFLCSVSSHMLWCISCVCILMQVFYCVLRWRSGLSSQLWFLLFVDSWGTGFALRVQWQGVPARRGLSAQLPAPVHMHGRSGGLHAPLSSPSAAARLALLVAPSDQARGRLLRGMGVWWQQPHQWGARRADAHLLARQPAPSQPHQCPTAGPAAASAPSCHRRGHIQR